MVRLLSVFTLMCGLPTAFLVMWTSVCIVRFEACRWTSSPRLPAWKDLLERALILSGLMLFTTLFWAVIAFGAYKIGLPW